MLTLTNAPTLPAEKRVLPKFQKVRLKGADAEAMVEVLDAEALPAEVVKLTPEEFRDRFEAAYRDELAARRA